jgi:hypothetical protein
MGQAVPEHAPVPTWAEWSLRALILQETAAVSVPDVLKALVEKMHEFKHLPTF